MSTRPTRKPPGLLASLLKAVLPARYRQEERLTPAIVPPMARPSWQPSPASLYNPFFRLAPAENLYLNEQLVELIPCINAAVDRITQLVGCPTVMSEDEEGAAGLMEWWEERVRVNRVQTGGSNLFASLVKAHLIYGRAHCEIIPTARYNDIYALQLLHTRTVCARPTPGAYGVDWVQETGFGQPMVLDPDLLLTVIHDMRDDNPNGNSLLFGMQFMAEILNKMTTALRNTWERFGVPTFVVIWDPPEGMSDPNGTKAQAVVSTVVNNLEQAMQARLNGETRDIAAAGKYRIEILGAEGEALNIEIPGRMILEQLVAKTGLPSWMLGFHWSTTERMSSVQASLLGELIDEVRAHLEAEVRYLFKLRQAFVGRPFDFDIDWEAPSLIDEMEQAQAEKAEAEAGSARLKLLEREWTLGIRQDFEVAQAMRPELEGKTEAEVRAACPNLLEAPPVPVSPFGAGPREPGEEGGGPPRPLSPFGRSLTYGESHNGHG